MAQAGPTFAEGDTVEAVFPDDGELYSGVVEKNNGDGTFEVRWDDADGGPETSPVKTEDMKKIVPRVPLEELKVGAKMKGVVRGSREFGIFVDINAERDGLVHVSKMPKGKSGPLEVGEFVEARDPEEGQFYQGTIEKVDGETFEIKWEDPGDGPESVSCSARDIRRPPRSFEIDEEIEVWVERVQIAEGRLSLTMQEPAPPVDLSEFQSIHPDDWLDGQVVSVASFGAFVRVKSPSSGSEQQGLVHVSQIRDGFVDDIFSEVQDGQEVKVRVVSVDMDRGRLSLTMKGGEGGDDSYEE